MEVRIKQCSREYIFLSTDNKTGKHYVGSALWWSKEYGRGGSRIRTLSQKALAHLVGVSQAHISEMEHGKRPIGKDMARRLAKALKVNYRVFL